MHVACGMLQLHIDGKTAVFPLITHRCYWSLALNHPHQEANSLAYHPGDEGMDKYNASKDTGPRLNIKTVFPCMEILILMIRRSWDRFIFILGIPILLRRHLYIESDAWDRYCLLFCLLNSMICFTSKLYNFDWLFDTKTPRMHYPCRFGKGLTKTFVCIMKTSRILNHIQILPLRLYKPALTSEKV